MPFEAIVIIGMFFCYTAAYCCSVVSNTDRELLRNAGCLIYNIDYRNKAENLLYLSRNCNVPQFFIVNFLSWIYSVF